MWLPYESHWIPLTWLSLVADHRVGGRDPRRYHRTNLVLHAANSVLLFAVLTLLTGARWRSAAAAGVFAVHPLHVESVAWIAERKDVLSGLFFLLTLGAWGYYARRPRLGRYLGVMALLAAGLMSKPMLVSVPALLLLLDYWPLGRLTRRASDGGVQLDAGRVGRAVVEKLPLLGLAAAAGAATWWAQQRGGAMTDQEVIPLAARLSNALVAVVRYGFRSLWPGSLSALYPHPLDGLPSKQALGAGLLVLGVTLCCVAGGRRRPALAVGWLWYLGMLVPVLGLVQVGRQATADRYMYLPQIGLTLAAIWSVPAAWSAGRAGRALLTSGAAAILIVWVAMARDQVGHWRDGVTLFARAHEVAAPTP